MNKLGLDLFSLRSQGWSPLELLDFCSRNGAQIAHFSEPRFLGSLDEENLKKVKAHADDLGLGIEVGFGSICPTSTRFNPKEGTAPDQLRRMLFVARTLGSPIVRCYLGSMADRSTAVPLERHIDNVVAVCQAVAADFEGSGVKIAIENHAGDLQALELRDLIERAGNEHVGALVDAGNAAWTLEDPLHTLETLAPYAVTTGVRDARIWETADGADVMWVPLGDGNIDIRRWYDRLRELRPDLPFALEIIHTRGPRSFPYKQPEFWQAYRDVPAWVFAGYLRLARSGEAYEGFEPAPVSREQDPEAFQRWAVEQERRDVERDLAFCRQELGLGTAVSEPKG